MFTFNRHAPSVYFIKDEISGLIKVGYSRSVNSRITAIKRDGKQPLLFAIMAGSTKQEKEVHALFDRFQVEPEWFLPSPLLLEYIAANAFRVGKDIPVPKYLEESAATYVTITCSVHSEIQQAIGHLAISERVSFSAKTNEILCRAFNREDLLSQGFSGPLWKRS